MINVVICFFPTPPYPHPRSALLQVTDNFDHQDFNRMCWTLCFRKNLDHNQLFISNDDAFKVWSLFNFLSEERYPLIIVAEEVTTLFIKQ